MFAYANINGVARCRDSSSNSVCHINNQCMEMYPRTTYRKIVKYPISEKSLKKLPRKFSHIGKWSRTLMSYTTSSLQGLSQSFISQDSSRFEYLYLITFLVFKLFLVCVGALGGKPLQYLEGRGSLCFHGLTFLLSIGLSTERLTNPSDVLALKVFRLDANKTNMKLDKIFIM